MKLSDFSRPALRALAVSAAALAVSTTAYAHARPTSYEPAPNAKAMHLALQPLAAGRYTVKWIAVATDDHLTQGTYAFTVK